LGTALEGSAPFARGMLVGGESYQLAEAIMPAIDDYAEHETGNREYF
jgi:hypothetical protein